LYDDDDDVIDLDNSSLEEEESQPKVLHEQSSLTMHDVPNEPVLLLNQADDQTQEPTAESVQTAQFQLGKRLHPKGGNAGPNKRRRIRIHNVKFSTEERESALQLWNATMIDVKARRDQLVASP
jgi:hypothetical protein